MSWGEIPYELPRVLCECGGSVKVDFGGLIRPFQRIGDDVDAQIQHLGGIAVSLRQMSEWFEHLRIGPLALRTLTQRLHLLTDLDPNRKAEDVPPVLQVDAVWVTLLRANGRVQRDRKGRKRSVKGRFKVPIMIAMGLWPDSERREILLWRMAENEGAEEWVKFLEIAAGPPLPRSHEQYELSSEVNATLGWDLLIPGETSQTLGGSGLYAERPTITYVPVVGAKFTENLLTPIPPSAVLFLVQAGYPVRLVFGMCVRTLNDLDNHSVEPLCAREADPEFERLVDLLENR